MTIQQIVPSSTIAAPLDFTNNLSPDALMVYLSTRLNGLDDQINAIFNTQQNQQKVQSALSKIKAELEKLDDKSDPNKLLTMPDLETPAPDPGRITPSTEPLPAPGTSEIEKNINTQIEEIRRTDPNLAADLQAKLGQPGFILYVQDGKYFSNEVTNSTEFINGLSKDIENSSQMNMIQLQSLMSARQTAIQLSTNLISSLGESSKAIASNIGR
jgi:chaperonin cofactor prefoldin